MAVRLHENLDFDWGHGTPLTELPADNFSIRWTTQQNSEAARYTFNLTSDGEAALYIDGKLVLDNRRPIEDTRSVVR